MQCCAGSNPFLLGLRPKPIQQRFPIFHDRPCFLGAGFRSIVPPEERDTVGPFIERIVAVEIASPCSYEVPVPITLAVEDARSPALATIRITTPICEIHGEGLAEHATRGTVDGKMHTGDGAIDGDTHRQALQLLL